jgi:hypothetical protein
MRTSGHCSTVLLIALATSIAAGQSRASIAESPTTVHSTPQKMASGSIVGRVFAITKGGDLKLARLASVYLFFNRGPGVSNILATAGSTPGVVFLEKDLAALNEAPATSCRHDLVAADKALLQTLEWARRNQLTDLVLLTDTDEEGNFQIKNAKPGTYELVVRGQAGSNDTYWDQEVEIKSNQEVKAKVASVQAACSDLR